MELPNKVDESEIPDVTDLLDRPIAFHRSFAKIAGSVNAGVMLSQAFYWAKRTKDSDGWFYKTQDEWESETCLTRREQETARKLLRETGFWEEKRSGNPARLYYKIDRRAFSIALFRLAQNANLDWQGKPDKSARPRQTPRAPLSDQTENTTENTASVSPQEIPRQPGSDDAYDASAQKYLIEEMRTPPLGFYGAVESDVLASYPNLGTPFKDIYELWFLKYDRLGGVGRSTGQKATLRQYHSSIKSYCKTWELNNKSRSNGNGNGHKPADDYRGPGRNTESDAARKKRESCPDCNGTNNRLRYVTQGGRQVQVSDICKHENSTG